MGLTWMASYRPAADESPSVPEWAMFSNTPIREAMPPQQPHHLASTFAPPASTRRFDRTVPPKKHGGGTCPEGSLSRCVPDRSAAGPHSLSCKPYGQNFLRSASSVTCASASTSISRTNPSPPPRLDIMDAIIVTLRSQAILHRVRQSARPRLHRSGGITE